MSNHDEGCHGHDFDLDDNAPDDINNVHKNLLQISSPQKKDSPTEVNLHHKKTTNTLHYIIEKRAKLLFPLKNDDFSYIFNTLPFI